MCLCFQKKAEEVISSAINTKNLNMKNLQFRIIQRKLRKRFQQILLCVILR